MSKTDEKIVIENVNTPGQTSRVNKAMYDAMKQAMLKILPATSPGMTQKEIFEAVIPHLPADLYPGGDKAGWWMMAVKLDLEAKEIIVRVKTKPLRWYMR